VQPKLDGLRCLASADDMLLRSRGGNLVELINGNAPIYATDPAYAGKLRTIIAMTEVEAALNVARSRGVSWSITAPPFINNMMAPKLWS
jgi:hypothetical protein